jgi:hypothetical protein
VASPPNNLPKTVGLSAPEAVFTGATFTANRILRKADGSQAAGSAHIGFEIDGGSMNRNACVADGCLLTAPPNPGPFKIRYRHREAGDIVVELTIQAVKKTAGGGRRRRTQRSRRGRGSRRH